MHTVLRYKIPTDFSSAIRVSTGRSAIYLLANMWKAKQVLMPCWVPEGVIDPFVKSGAEIIFYRLTETLRPSVGDIAVKIQNTDRPIVVVINYFGFSSFVHTQEIKEITASRGGLLFVDCAHGGYDKNADVTLEVRNKLFPVTDGAIMRSRRNDVDFSAYHLKNHLMPNFEALVAYNSHLRANQRFAEGLDGCPPEMAMDSCAATYDLYYNDIRWDFALRAQSQAAMNYELLVDMSLEIGLRRADSAMYAKHLDSQLSVRSANDCFATFGYPIHCRGMRSEMKKALTDIGIYPSTLEHRWDHIPDSPEFNFEREFIKDHLILPVGRESLASIANASSVLNDIMRNKEGENVAERYGANPSAGGIATATG